MNGKIVERIVRDSGVANLVELLAEKLQPTDLQSLLLAVFHRRAAQQDPRRVLQQYEQNPFVRPATTSVMALLELDRLAFALAAPPFEALDLAPLAPLGACSALGPVDQNRVVSTIRNTEVVSDATNVLALECASRRRELRRDSATAQQLVRVCANHRLVRAQKYTQPNMLAHFRMFSLCTAGRSVGGADFETAALREQVGFYLRFLAAIVEQGYRFTGLRVPFIPLAGATARQQLEQHVLQPLAQEFPAARLEIDPDGNGAPGYYEWVRFGVYASAADGNEFMLGDGGFTAWTRRLISDERERLLTSGIATERIASLFRA